MSLEHVQNIYIYIYKELFPPEKAINGIRVRQQQCVCFLRQREKRIKIPNLS